MRGIQYTRRTRERIERIIVEEEHRFLRLMAFVHPEWATLLHREFDASRWSRAWNASWLETFRAAREKARAKK
jgi:hypothetical protein